MEMEKVQRRATKSTKLIPNLVQQSYEKRLRAFGLPTPEEKRKRGNLI